MSHAGLEEHYAGFLKDLDSDFRAASISALVCSLAPQGRILDFGCGTGATSAELWRTGRDVVSMDSSPEMLRMCREHLSMRKLPAGNVQHGDVGSIGTGPGYDGVIALDVIEHIEDDLTAVRQLRAALKPGGALVLSVPAMSSLFGPKDVDVGHFRRYDRKPLLALLERAGLRVELCRYWNLLGVAPVWISVLRGKRLSEKMRYAGTRSRLQRALNDALRVWFLKVENNIRPPRGLTLLVRAVRG